MLMVRVVAVVAIFLPLADCLSTSLSNVHQVDLTSATPRDHGSNGGGAGGGGGGAGGKM